MLTQDKILAIVMIVLATLGWGVQGKWNEAFGSAIVLAMTYGVQAFASPSQAPTTLRQQWPLLAVAAAILIWMLVSAFT